MIMLEILFKSLSSSPI